VVKEVRKTELSDTLDIKLTKGFACKVDKEDYEYLSQFKWRYHNGYASRNEVTWCPLAKKTVKTKQITLHRLIIACPDGMTVDHINGDKLDNRKSNLRICNHQQNCWNRPLQNNSTTGSRGVSYHKKMGKWMVYLTYNGKRKHLGYFSSLEEATARYDEEASKHYGEYARLNDIRE
jgi:hypothetical protein